jgi:hypothetical protein
MTTDKENQEPPRGDNETKEMELDGKFVSWAVLFTNCTESMEKSPIGGG